MYPRMCLLLVSLIVVNQLSRCVLGQIGGSLQFGYGANLGISSQKQTEIEQKDKQEHSELNASADTLVEKFKGQLLQNQAQNQNQNSNQNGAASASLNANGIRSLWETFLKVRQTKTDIVSAGIHNYLQWKGAGLEKLIGALKTSNNGNVEGQKTANNVQQNNSLSNTIHAGASHDGSKATLNGKQDDNTTLTTTQSSNNQNENITPLMNHTQSIGSEAQIKKDQQLDKDNIVCIDITDINVLNELRDSLKAMETDNNNMISKNAATKK